MGEAESDFGFQSKENLIRIRKSVASFVSFKRRDSMLSVDKMSQTAIIERLDLSGISQLRTGTGN